MWHVSGACAQGTCTGQVHGACVRKQSDRLVGSAVYQQHGRRYTSDALEVWEGVTEGVDPSRRAAATDGAEAGRRRYEEAEAREDRCVQDGGGDGAARRQVEGGR